MDVKEDIKTLMKAFDDGIFIRNIDKDYEPGWAIRLAPIISSLGRLKTYSDDDYDYDELRDLMENAK